MGGRAGAICTDRKIRAVIHHRGTDNSTNIDLYGENHGQGQAIILIHGYRSMVIPGEQSAALLRQGTRSSPTTGVALGSPVNRPPPGLRHIRGGSQCRTGHSRPARYGARGVFHGTERSGPVSERVRLHPGVNSGVLRLTAALSAAGRRQPCGVRTRFSTDCWRRRPRIATPFSPSSSTTSTTWMTPWEPGSRRRRCAPTGT